MAIVEHNTEIRSLESGAYTPSISENWCEKKAYRCHVCLFREDDGSYSVVVLNLPGCGSCGSTAEEAMENVCEAILGVTESHIESNEEIPWVDSSTEDIPEGSIVKWILVNA